MRCGSQIALLFKFQSVDVMKFRTATRFSGHQRRALKRLLKLNFKKFVFMLLDENVINIAAPLET